MSIQGVGRYFPFIKNKVSSDWKDLAWCLGFETPDIDNIDGKHKDDKSRCMDLLQQWYKREGNAATIHVLMEALQDAELQHVVDSLKDKYPELNEKPKSPTVSSEQKAIRKAEELHWKDTVLPVHLQLGLMQTGDISKEHKEQIIERILELEKTLFTAEVLADPERYRQMQEIFLPHAAVLMKLLSGSVILLLTFLRQTDVDGFYHNHYRVGEGSLSQQLSHILISEHLQDKVKGAQLIVRLHVKHEDYVRVRGRLGQGLDRTTSVDNLLALPPASTHVDHSRLSSLDLAVTVREDKPRTEDITMLYREVQSAVQTTKEKSKQEVKVPRQVLRGTKEDALRREAEMVKEEDEKPQKLLLELKEKFQQLKETNKSKDARIKKLLTAKEPVEGGSHQKKTRKKKDITMPYRQVQSKDLKVKLQTIQGQLLTSRREVDALIRESKMLKEKNQKARKVFLEQKAEMNKKIQQLQEINKNKEAIIKTLLTAKQSVESVRLIRKERPWVRKVRFGGEGSGRGEFTCPSGVAVSQHNEVYIADWWNTRIQVFTIDGVYIREFTTTLPGETGNKVTLKPWDVAVDRNDNLWVVGDDHVVQYSREGTCLVEIDLPYVETGRSITVAMTTEQVLVTEYDGENGQLRVFDQDGSEMDTYGSGHLSPEPWWPCCVTVDGEGNILVTDSNNHCVHVLDSEGNFKFKFGSEGSDKSQLKYPQGICVNGMGNIIVADFGNGCVKMFDNEGRFLCHKGSGMKQPWGVAVSPGGDVVVTDWKHHTASVWTVP
ncbi:uncharacterized protein LOC144865172 [Branchiostoma floridae x Branchiostoma japonicum]